MKNIVIKTMLCMLLMVLFTGFYGVQESLAIPVYPIIHTLTQPDGTTFSARPWGDEWLSGWETVEGFTIAKNPEGYWTYVGRDVSGWLIPTVFVVGKDDPASQGIPKHLRPAAVIMQRVCGTMRTPQTSRRLMRTPEEPRRVVSATKSIAVPVIFITFADTLPSDPIDRLHYLVEWRGEYLPENLLSGGHGGYVLSVRWSYRRDEMVYCGQRS